MSENSRHHELHDSLQHTEDEKVRAKEDEMMDVQARVVKGADGEVAHRKQKQ